MKAVKAVFRDGKVQLVEPPPSAGPVEVLVVFPEDSDDPWQHILEDATPRPALSKAVDKVLDRGRKS
ncbi:MAG: hypothetical protein L0Z62_33470 [Gemmataceae bacterium]|nr:hypothetical protein [Gemmataceae bacterium]